MKKIWFAAFVVLLAGFVIAQEGPKNDSGDTVARPRNKKDAPAAEPETQLPKIPSKFNKKESLPEAPSFHSDALTINVDVAVLDNTGHFIPNIPKQYFRILEDNVPQTLSLFGHSEAPMTVCLLIEFSNLYQQFYTEAWYQTLTAAYGFVGTLKPEDYVAVIAYDMRPEILSDFSTNRQDAQEAMSRMRMAAFSEANLFDSLVYTAERMQDIDSRKSIRGL